MTRMLNSPDWRFQDLSPEDQQRINDFQHRTPLHGHLDFRMIEASRDGVRARMPVAAPACNATGNLHGGAIATLIDFSAGTCAAIGSGFVPGEQTLVTADMHVRYLGRPRGDHVDAVSTIVRAGRTLIIVDCQVVDPDGRVVAVADFSAMVVDLRQALKPELTTDPSGPDI